MPASPPGSPPRSCTNYACLRRESTAVAAGRQAAARTSATISSCNQRKVWQEQQFRQIGKVTQELCAQMNTGARGCCSWWWWGKVATAAAPSAAANGPCTILPPLVLAALMVSSLPWYRISNVFCARTRYRGMKQPTRVSGGEARMGRWGEHAGKPGVCQKAAIATASAPTTKQ